MKHKPTLPKGDKDQGEVDSSTVTSGASIPVSVPEKAYEALAGPDPEPMTRRPLLDQNLIVYESEPEPTQRRQSGIAFKDSFIVSKKRSSDSSKKLNVSNPTPVELEASRHNESSQESKKMSKR
ncbi:hypothetical protein Tco_0458979 [Tanacetum coccineum]